MPATILTEKIKPAGNEGMDLGNIFAHIYKVSGASIAAADTGTITLNFKPQLDAAGLPVIVGLPTGITATAAANVVTLTAVGTYTNLNAKVLILGQK